MLVDYLLAIIAVMVLKIQKSQTALLLFYRGQMGLFSPVVGLNVGMLHILFMSDIWSTCAEFIVLK
jgi:hypothetical protein